MFSTEWALGHVRMCVCFPFRELTRGVERHSLCLVLTSLEFKRPKGSLGWFSHHATCDSHYTLHIHCTFTHMLLYTLTPPREHVETTWTHSACQCTHTHKHACYIDYDASIHRLTHSQLWHTLISEVTSCLMCEDHLAAILVLPIKLTIKINLVNLCCSTYKTCCSSD